MSLSIYQISVPVFIRMLGNLSAILAKAEAHAQARSIEPTVLLNARLAPDMFPLARQVQIASDAAKGCAARLAGVEIPSYADDEQSFAELQAYIQRLQASGYQVKKHLVKLYAKLSFPVAHLVMALVAIPLAVQAPRGGRLAGIGLAIGILAGYMLVDYSAVAFARADLLPPLMAAWTANIVFLGIAAALLLRART